MESPPRATTKRASKHRSSYTKELDKLKANLAKWKTKLDTDNANFEIEQAELRSIREDFIAGLSKFFNRRSLARCRTSGTPVG